MTPAKRITAKTPGIEITVKAEDALESPLESYAVKGIVSADSPECFQFCYNVQEMIDEHGLWGWCSVHVAARFGPLYGHAYLGGCSYKDEDDFKAGGYFEQLRDEAIAELQWQIDELLELLEPETIE